MAKKRKRKAWWSKAAGSPKELKKWFSDRGRDVCPTPVREVIWARPHAETRAEFIARLEIIAEERQRLKRLKKKIASL